MRPPKHISLPAILLAALGLVGQATAQSPIEDTGLTTATPRPDPDLVVVREKSYGASGVDLTSYGIGTEPVDHVQSLYFRFFVDNDSSEDATAGRVVLPPGMSILGFIVDGGLLGGSADDMVLTETDALFGIADPDDYSEQSRGFGFGAANATDEFVCATAPDRFVFGLNVTVGVDDFRVIVDYGDSFPPGLSMDLAAYNLGSLGGVPVERGIHVGDPGSAVPGAGDYDEFGSVTGIPLTGSSDPQVGFDLPFQPLQNVFIIRDPPGPTRIDGYDVVEQLPSPSRASLEVRVQNPVGMTDGPDGLLHAIGVGGGYAEIDPVTGADLELLLEDRTGDYVDLTDLPGTRDLYVVRDTTGDTEIDVLDVDSPSFVPTFTVPAMNLADPVAITDAADGLIYVLGASGGLVPVDPGTGPQTPIAFVAPSGSYVSATGAPGVDAVYLLRDAGPNASVDRFDIATSMVQYNFATVLAMDDAISITDAVGDRLVLIGRGAGSAPLYVELATSTGSQITSNACLDFAGTNASITNVATDSPNTPGEPGGIEDQQVLVTDYDNGTGNLSILYGVACESTDNTIHYGPLTYSDMAAYNYTGRDCGIGNSGSYDTFDPGPGSYFFLVAADDGTVEGSYGRSSAPVERPADLANPTCFLPQDLSANCSP